MNAGSSSAPQHRVCVNQSAAPCIQVRALLDSNAGTAGCAMASKAVRDRYLEATGQSPEKPETAAAAAKAPEGDCPICFEPLAEEGVPPEELAACEVCHNHVHVLCMRNWAQQRRSAGQAVSCAMCRAPWPDDAVGAHTLFCFVPRRRSRVRCAARRRQTTLSVCIRSSCFESVVLYCSSSPGWPSRSRCRVSVYPLFTCKSSHAKAARLRCGDSASQWMPLPRHGQLTQHNGTAGAKGAGATTQDGLQSIC